MDFLGVKRQRRYVFEGLAFGSKFHEFLHKTLETKEKVECVIEHTANTIST
jgi:hypothetical protein